jgi:hypothetical protein
MVTHDRFMYDSVEHAFQAAKTHDPTEKLRISTVKTAAEAKRMGRQVTLRSDWDEVKLSIMNEIVRIKFWLNRDLADKLVLTFPDSLVEGNSWGDTYWGVYNGHGENHLGKILVQVRNETMEMQRRDIRMRDPDRIDGIIDLFREYWKFHPQLRAGQILGIASGNQDPFYLEDDVLEAWFKERKETHDEHV